MDELVSEGRNRGWCKLIIVDEEVLQSIDDEAHITVASLHDLHYPVPDLFEKKMSLPEVYLL